MKEETKKQGSVSEPEEKTYVVEVNIRSDADKPLMDDLRREMNYQRSFLKRFLNSMAAMMDVYDGWNGVLHPSYIREGFLHMAVTAALLQEMNVSVLAYEGTPFTRCLKADKSFGQLLLDIFVGVKTVLQAIDVESETVKLAHVSYALQEMLNSIACYEDKIDWNDWDKMYQLEKL